MSENAQSLSHSKWDCKYHVVFVPKRRRQELFGHLRQKLGPIFRDLAHQKKCEVIEGHTSPDHVHFMCIAIPPKYAVASVIGFMKGKSESVIPSLLLSCSKLCDDARAVQYFLFQAPHFKNG